jgi:hypothetical protein
MFETCTFSMVEESRCPPAFPINTKCGMPSLHTRYLGTHRSPPDYLIPNSSVLRQSAVALLLSAKANVNLSVTGCGAVLEIPPKLLIQLSSPHSHDASADSSSVAAPGPQIALSTSGLGRADAQLPIVSIGELERYAVIAVL